MTKRIATIIAISALLAGCGWISARKVPVQQGNKITQKMVNQIKPGMSPAEIVKVMGPPVLENTFQDDALHYVYTVNSDKENTLKRVVLTFKKGKLVQISGNVYPQ